VLIVVAVAVVAAFVVVPIASLALFVPVVVGVVAVGVGRRQMSCSSADELVA